MSDPAPPRRRKSFVWPRVFVLVVLLAEVVALFAFGPPQQTLARVGAWIESLGPLAPAALVALCVAFCVFLIPVSVLALTAGALLGMGEGFLWMVVGLNLGALAAYEVGRTLARPWAVARFGHRLWFGALNEAVTERGFTTVLLCRLSPAFPYFVMNYVLALTAIRRGPYVAGTALGMIPGTAGVVYLGAVARETVEGVARPWWQWLILAAGLAATVLVIWGIARRAKALLRGRLRRGPAGGPAGLAQSGSEPEP